VALTPTLTLTLIDQEAATAEEAAAAAADAAAAKAEAAALAEGLHRAPLP